ncbi:MAG: TolC family protein [Candidatus Latescibacteria bacterium]|nr:TolC family protein [Candidatus Latescibacterota bacterium]
MALRNLNVQEKFRYGSELLVFTLHHVSRVIRHSFWYRYGWYFLLPVIVIGQTATVRAEEADTTALSLEQAVTRALTYGEDVRIAEAQVDLAEAQVSQARADILPQLSVSLGYHRQIRSIFRDFGVSGPQLPPFPPDTTSSLGRWVSALASVLSTAGLADSPFGRVNNWNAGVTVYQTIFEGTKLWTAPRVAGLVRDAADAQLREQRWETTLQVKRAYYDALLTERVAEIARLSLDQAERQLVQVRHQHDEGNLSDFDLLQVEVQRDNQIPDVVSADNQCELALLNLKRLIGLSVNARMRLTSGCVEPAMVQGSHDGAPLTAGVVEPTMVSRMPDGLPSLSSLLERSKARPAVEAAKSEVEARRRAVGIVGADRWPKLSLSSTYSRQAFPSGTFPGRDDWRTDWAVGVTMSLSLFDGLRTQGKLDEARLNVTIARERLAQMEEMIALTVEQAYRNVERARAQIDARQQTINQAERALHLAELRYEEGISTQLEVTDSRLQLQRARVNQAQALHDYSVALAGLERVTGVKIQK